MLNSGGYAKADRLFVIDFDPATGALVIDGKGFRDAGSDRPGVNLSQRAWPHGFTGTTAPRPTGQCSPGEVDVLGPAASFHAHRPQLAFRGLLRAALSDLYGQVRRRHYLNGSQTRSAFVRHDSPRDSGGHAGRQPNSARPRARAS